MTVAPHLGRELLRRAEDRIEALAYVIDTPVGDWNVSGIEALTDMLDCSASSAALVAKHRADLAYVSGRRTTLGILRWVEAVRPVLLERWAREMDHAADSQGAVADHVVENGRQVVSERSLAARHRRDAPPRRAPLVRLARSVGGRARGRARRRRSSSASGSRSGSPGREPEPEPEPPSAALVAREAAA